MMTLDLRIRYFGAFWQINDTVFKPFLYYKQYFCLVFTMRCYAKPSIATVSYPSIHDVEVSWSHRLEQ